MSKQADINRVHGFYWIKIWDEWVVAEYRVGMFCNVWCIPGNDCWFEDYQLDEIDETQITRDENI